MSLLTVQRDAGWADKLRQYRILVDGEEVGRLSEGDQLRIELDEGKHSVTAKIDWCGSEPLLIDMTSEDQVVRVRSALRGARVFLALFYALFNRSGYLVLERQP